MLINEQPVFFSRERLAIFCAFGWFFCILASYSMVRPVRETMGTVVGKGELKWLFLAGFLAMCAIVPLYALLVQRVSHRSIARVVFHGFALSSLGFLLTLNLHGASENLWIARLLFVWISVLGIFSTSVFWSVLADLFGSDQGKRLFGVIASGGTIGAIAGSFVTSQVAGRLETAWLMLFPAVLLELGLLFGRYLELNSRGSRVSDEAEAVQDEELRQGGLFSGVQHVAKSSYLMRLAAFLMFVQAFGTLLYTEQATIVRNEIVGEMARTEFFASIDFYSQSLTLLFQLVIAGWVMRRLGIAFALVLLPVIYFSSLVSLSLKPELIVLAVVMIVTRSCAYGMTVPAREVLFTVVSREDKYKAKNFIDTVVVRGGDSISMQFIGLMTSLGVTAGAIRLGALPLAILWAILAWNLGKKQSKMDADTLGS